MPMRIKLNSVLVPDQDEALRFYTDVLGFVKAKDIPLGEFRWLTVVSPDEPNGAELLLEPNANPAAATYQQALQDSGIAAIAFEVDDVEAEFDRLKQAGVAFKMDPTDVGSAVLAVFDDSCGNLVQIYRPK